MSFVVSEKFHTVNSVECNETRSQMLTKNIDTITHPNNQTQSNVLTNNYLEVMHSINQDIVSLTPLSEAPDTSITRKLCFFFFVKTPGRYSERCTSQTQNKVLDFQSSGEFRQQLLHKQTWSSGMLQGIAKLRPHVSVCSSQKVGSRVALCQDSGGPVGGVWLAVVSEQACCSHCLLYCNNEDIRHEKIWALI